MRHSVDDTEMANQPQISTISENYKVLKVLGHGCYGHVIKCLKRDTGETVAVKVLKQKHSLLKNVREVAILEKLKCLNPDTSNIVRCHECFHSINKTFMVFEILDMSLYDYMCWRKWAPLPLYGTRTIIKDMATALNALKGIGLIHTDLKLDNIMLVNHEQEPFRVRLIDFGLAVHKHEVRPGLCAQPLWYRSPEILFGLKFTEAIDIWSLGSVTAELLLGFALFPGQHEYDVLRFIIDVLGEPPKRLLNDGKNTELFYHRSHKCGVFRQWRFKMPVEFYTETGIKPLETRRQKFSSLDELKTVSLHQEDSSTESAGRSACVELLKEMLQMDPRNRITASEVLAHPFITGNHLSPSNSSHLQAVQKKATNSLRAKHEDLKLESITYSVKANPAVNCNIIGTPLIPPNSPDEAPADFTLNQGSSSISICHTPEASQCKEKKNLIRRFFSTLMRCSSCFHVPEDDDE